MSQETRLLLLKAAEAIIETAESLNREYTNVPLEKIRVMRAAVSLIIAVVRQLEAEDLMKMTG